MQECSNSIANALEILQSRTKLSKHKWSINNFATTMKNSCPVITHNRCCFQRPVVITLLDSLLTTAHWVLISSIHTWIHFIFKGSWYIWQRWLWEYGPSWSQNAYHRGYPFDYVSHTANWNMFISWWRRDLDTLFALLTLSPENPSVNSGFLAQSIIGAGFWWFLLLLAWIRFRAKTIYGRHTHCPLVRIPATCHGYR